MKPLKMLLIFLLALVPAAKISSQNNTTPDSLMKFSLQEALLYAIENNYTVKNSATDIEIAKKKVWETTAIGLPQINAQGSYQHLFKVPEISFGGETFLATSLPAGTPITADDITNENVYMGFNPGEPIKLGLADNTILDITVSQLIFSGEYIVGLQATKTFKLATEQNLIKTELEIKQLVYDSYHLVLVLRESQKIGEDILANIVKTEFELSESLKAGF